MRFAFTTVCLLMLYGCATPEQIAAQRAYEQQQLQAQQEAYTRSLNNQCRAIGYQPETEGFRQCILTLHTQRQQEDTQMRGIILQQAIQQRQQQQYQSMPLCSSLPPGLAGYARAQGSCR